MKRYAKILQIELLFLSAYSPNLNLIERFWKYVKKQVLYSIFHKTYDIFKQNIDKCLTEAFINDKEKIDKLLNLEFQSFKKVNILPV